MNQIKSFSSMYIKAFCHTYNTFKVKINERKELWADKSFYIGLIIAGEGFFSNSNA